MGDFIYTEGVIFKVEDKEYKLRYINEYGTCWLEPIIFRNGSHCVSGGLNRICNAADLDDLEEVIIE